MNSLIIRRYYLLALFSIAFIISIGQLVIYYNLTTQETDASLLNDGRPTAYAVSEIV